MAERTEGAGAAASILTVTMGGEPYRLRALTIEKAEAWQVLMARLAAGMSVDPGAEPADIFAGLMAAGTNVGIEALRAYDDAGDAVLGGAERIRKLMLPSELRSAMEVVVSAAVPFDEDASRSVALAFGGPSRVLATTLMTTMAQVILGSRAQAPSTPTPSDAGASDGTASDGSGPPSSSSSDGSTAMNGTDSMPSSAGTSWPTA